ncbi:MAG TPA: PIN domain-containing protein [Thermoanaerobaculia bacterium]|nr:PIN domain-containing protein [Thermoanaerobaculia bacterium]
MSVLVDTSVWSLALRRRNPAGEGVVRELQELIREGRVHLIGPIRQEVLSGIREAAQFQTLRDRLRSFPDLPVETVDHERAAEHFNLCRHKGVQGSNTDFLLCAVAERHNLAILTTDGDFESFSRHLPISLHRPRLTGLP